MIEQRKPVPEQPKPVVRPEAAAARKVEKVAVAREAVGTQKKPEAPTNTALAVLKDSKASVASQKETASRPSEAKVARPETTRNKQAEGAAAPRDGLKPQKPEAAAASKETARRSAENSTRAERATASPKAEARSGPGLQGLKEKQSTVNSSAGESAKLKGSETTNAKKEVATARKPIEGAVAARPPAEKPKSTTDVAGAKNKTEGVGPSVSKVEKPAAPKERGPESRAVKGSDPRDVTRPALSEKPKATAADGATGNKTGQESGLGPQQIEKPKATPERDRVQNLDAPKPRDVQRTGKVEGPRPNADNLGGKQRQEGVSPDRESSDKPKFAGEAGSGKGSGEIRKPKDAPGSQQIEKPKPTTTEAPPGKKQGQETPPGMHQVEKPKPPAEGGPTQRTSEAPKPKELQGGGRVETPRPTTETPESKKQTETISPGNEKSEKSKEASNVGREQTFTAINMTSDAPTQQRPERSKERVEQNALAQNSEHPPRGRHSDATPSPIEKNDVTQERDQKGASSETHSRPNERSREGLAGEQQGPPADDRREESTATHAERTPDYESDATSTGFHDRQDEETSAKRQLSDAHQGESENESQPSGDVKDHEPSSRQIEHPDPSLNDMNERNRQQHALNEAQRQDRARQDSERASAQPFITVGEPNQPGGTGIWETDSDRTAIQPLHKFEASPPSQSQLPHEHISPHDGHADKQDGIASSLIEAGLVREIGLKSHDAISVTELVTHLEQVPSKDFGAFSDPIASIDDSRYGEVGEKGSGSDNVGPTFKTLPLTAPPGRGKETQGFGVRFFGKEQVQFYTKHGARLGRADQPVFFSPLEDMATVRNASDAARLTGNAPSVTDAYVRREDVFGVSFPTRGLNVRFPSASDGSGPHFLEGGHTAVRLASPDEGFLLNPTREFVTPATAVPQGSVLFRIGSKGEWIAIRKF